MNMDINIGGNQCRLWKAMRRAYAFVFIRCKTLDTTDATIFYRYQRILHHSARTHESTRRYRADHRYPFVDSHAVSADFHVNICFRGGTLSFDL
jgi:hypothetical protein